MRKTRVHTEKGTNGRDEVLVSLRPEVLHDAEHAVGNLLQRIHHTARVALTGVEAEHRERVGGALGDLEGLLELLFDYVSPIDIEARPTDAGKVASSMLSQVREHAGESVAMNGGAEGKVLVDPRAISRCFQLIGRSLGHAWKESPEICVDVSAGAAGQEIAFAVCAEPGDGAPVGARARVGLAVAERLLDLQGGTLHWNGEGRSGACRVILPAHSGESSDGV